MYICPSHVPFPRLQIYITVSSLDYFCVYKNAGTYKAKEGEIAIYGVSPYTGHLPNQPVCKTRTQKTCATSVPPACYPLNIDLAWLYLDLTIPPLSLYLSHYLDLPCGLKIKHHRTFNISRYVEMSVQIKMFGEFLFSHESHYLKPST